MLHSPRNHALLITLSSLVALPASASITTYEIGGTGAPGSNFPDAYGGGTTWSIVVTLDTQQAVTNDLGNIASYAGISVEYTIGDVTFQQESTLFVNDDLTLGTVVDQLLLNFFQPGSGPGIPIDRPDTYGGLSLTGSQTLWNSTDIPALLPDVSDFDETRFVISQSIDTTDPAFIVWEGTVDYIRVVPAPGVSAVLIVMAGWRRRR
ncbi:MAG: hypothetical protein AAGB51_10220 [Planctomycetota bacterium]